MKIGFDTNVLCYLLNDERDFHYKIKQYFSQNFKIKPKVLLSSIVLSELLCGSSEHEINDLLLKLKNMFHIRLLDFDGKSAIENSLFIKSLGLQIDKDKSRQAIKTDFLIISNYKAYGATHIMTSDKKLLAIPENLIGISFIDVNDLPEVDRNLFGDII